MSLVGAAWQYVALPWSIAALFQRSATVGVGPPLLPRFAARRGLTLAPGHDVSGQERLPPPFTMLGPPPVGASAHVGCPGTPENRSFRTIIGCRRPSASIAVPFPAVFPAKVELVTTKGAS